VQNFIVRERNFYIIASRNGEMSSCASATACYLHLEGSARSSVDVALSLS